MIMVKELVNFTLKFKSAKITVQWNFEEGDELGNMVYKHPLTGKKVKNLNEILEGWQLKNSKYYKEYEQLEQLANDFLKKDNLYDLIENNKTIELYDIYGFDENEEQENVFDEYLKDKIQNSKNNVNIFDTKNYIKYEDAKAALQELYRDIIKKINER